MRVVLDGYYGMGNAGDDAFCVVAAALARSHWGSVRVGALARAGRMPDLTEPLEPLLPANPRFHGHQRIASLAATLRARHVVHVGGSTFSRMNRHMADQHLLARTGMSRLHAVAVSIGPFAEPADAYRLRDFLRHFDTISVRDSASMHRLGTLGLDGRALQSFDVAVLLPDLIAPDNSTAPEPASADFVLGVSVCGFERLLGAGPPGDETNRNQELLVILRDLARAIPIVFRFIVFNNHPRWGDRRLSEWFAARLSEIARVELVDYTGDVRRTLTAVRGCHAILGMRLHSAVFAYALGRPLAVLAYHQKCADFADDIGLPRSLVLPRTGLDPGFASVIAELMTDPKSFSPRLPISEALVRARAAFEQLPWHNGYV